MSELTFETQELPTVRGMRQAIDEEWEKLVKAFPRLYNFGPGYVVYPPYEGDADSFEVAVFVNATWENYRPTLFSLEGMFGDGTCFGIEFTEEDWQRLVTMVEAKRKEREEDDSTEES